MILYLDLYVYPKTTIIYQDTVIFPMPRYSNEVGFMNTGVFMVVGLLHRSCIEKANQIYAVI